MNSRFRNAEKIIIRLTHEINVIFKRNARRNCNKNYYFDRKKCRVKRLIYKFEIVIFKLVIYL